MPRFTLHPSSGTGIWNDLPRKVIRLVRYGCANRPFYHIVVMNAKLDPRKPPIEQLGTYDPMKNQFNEQLVSFNFERVQFWLGQGNVGASQAVEVLLGLAGFFPISKGMYQQAWRTRMKANQEAMEKESATLKNVEQTN